jgi:hypothetical protein
MQISAKTKTYIEAVRQFSGDQLKRADDCALLAETAAQRSLTPALDELCFTAKFLHKTFALMMRIGSLGEGYDKLAAEFDANSAKARDILTMLAGAMPEEDRGRFMRTYLELSATAFDAMMDLVHDLNWIKNYSLDVKAPE